ncbi:MAG: hypothetical protein ACRDL7_15335, partial [Gaiellaceae bacterium]
MHTAATPTTYSVEGAVHQTHLLAHGDHLVTLNESDFDDDELQELMRIEYLMESHRSKLHSVIKTDGYHCARTARNSSYRAVGVESMACEHDPRAISVHAAVERKHLVQALTRFTKIKLSDRSPSTLLQPKLAPFMLSLVNT